jgi:hypothetical protein
LLTLLPRPISNSELQIANFVGLILWLQGQNKQTSIFQIDLRTSGSVFLHFFLKVFLVSRSIRIWRGI